MRVCLSLFDKVNGWVMEKKGEDGRDLKWGEGRES